MNWSTLDQAQIVLTLYLYAGKKDNIVSPELLDIMGGKKVVKEGIPMIIFDWFKRVQVIHMSAEEKGGHGLACGEPEAV